MIENISTKKFIQVWLWAIAIVGVLSIFATIQQANQLQIIFWRSRWVFIVGMFAVTSLLSVWISTSSNVLSKLAQKIEETDNLFSNSLRQAIGLFLVVFGFAMVWLIRLFIFGNTLPQPAPIFCVFLWTSLFQVFGLKLIKPSVQWHVAFAIVLLFQGFVYQSFGIFKIVSSDPFSIGYSEAGRFYYASLFFSESLYGQQLPLPFLHPSRYLLLSIPFLIDGLPLWAHRLWQAFLWFGLTLTASFLVAARFKLGKWLTTLLTIWLFLFFLQGAVYYHLQICVILIFAGVSVKHFWRSLIFIILASLWAGISRVNWFPVPAMIAIAIYILETPLNAKGWKYWLTPFVWGVSGVASALLSQFLYIQISGNADISAFGSSFTSDLLWNRLLPNETYPMGILPGIALVSFPLWLGLYQMIKGNIQHFHLLRWLALLSMLVMLFVGGAIVSTKIGGGGDLHNMDAYMVMLAILTLYIWSKQASPENEAKVIWGNASWVMISSALLIPLWFAVPKISFTHYYDSETVQQDIQKINEVVQTAIQNGDEVLFITERQLLTFDYLNGITLIAEYEQSELMEMAMSRNKLYLEKYYAELQNRRFALVIAEDQKFTQQKEGAFVEENVAWVRFVGAPLLCNYKPLDTLSSNNIQIFEPRPNQAECKDPFSE